ncbi:hypothetical protein AB9E13_35445, partial [Rhizobium leguminosarum]
KNDTGCHLVKTLSFYFVFYFVLARRLKGGAGEDVTFGIRTEHLSLAEGTIALSTVNVDLFENIGGATMLYTTTPDSQL